MNTLVKKLQIKPGKWLFLNSPVNYLATLEPLPDDFEITFEAISKIDGAQLFVKTKDQLSLSLKNVIPLLNHDAVLWITFPKKSSGIKTDIVMMNIEDEIGQYNLTPVTSIAIDETWTALRLRSKELLKTSEVRNDNIRKNEFSQYIDVDNKLITLPSVIDEVLKENRDAFNFYQKLSYTNKKEYLLWILTAKQEKTQQERLVKLVEKLVNGKKNPSDK